MTKKLTITVPDDVYEELHERIGRRKISKFLERLARPHVVGADLESAYRDMAANAALDRVQVVPLTSTVARLYPCKTYVALRGQRRKAMADQAATVSKARLKEQIGTISADDMRAVEPAIKVQLGL